MKLSKLLIGSSALVLCTQAAQAQVQLNELYISHLTTDTEEYIELIGPPNTSLNNFAICVVEGDTFMGINGTLDRLWTLGGEMIPADGYYVVGNSTVAETDFDIGPQDNFENSSATFYLVETNDPGALTALLGTNVDMDGDLITDLATVATIIDVVGIVDADVGDIVYDGAQVLGPDGPFLPAGVFRDGDAPGGWCTDAFLDFDVMANADEMRTPGAMNVDCPGSGVGTTYCVGAPNSVGTGALTTATGSATVADNNFTLITDGLPGGVPGLYFFGPNQVQVAFGDGFRCVGGATRRVQPPAFSMGGTAMRTLDLTGPPAAGVVVSGADLNFQFWYRDAMGGPSGFNLSDGLNVVFN